MKKVTIHFVLLALAISVAPVFAGDADMSPLRLSPTKIPNCSKAYVCKDLPYGGRQVGKGAVHPDVAQTYDLYLPGNIGEIERPAPFYLFVHGGSWKHGNKVGRAGRHAELLAEMAEQGFVVASMNYVLCNGKLGGTHTFVEMLADIDAMVSHLPVLAKAAGISIPRIALGGNSAGGHLALLYAYDGANPSVLGLGLKHAVPVACVFTDCGPSDLASPEFIVAGLDWQKGVLAKWYGHLCVLAGGKYGREDIGTTVERLTKYSPVTLLNGKCPPTICLFGETGKVKTSGTFKRTKDGPTATYADFWKLVGSKETPPESVGMDGIVATQNYVALTNGLTKAGVPFVARLEPYSHCRILSKKPETRPWLYENLRKYLKADEAKPMRECARDVPEAASADVSRQFVSKTEYLDLMEAAVASYSDDHIRQYIDKCAREGVTEHGFPRLAANLACLVSNGRMLEKRDFLERMMSISCSCAPKGRMKLGGNEFSVKELAAAICELERAKVFDKSVTEAWRADIRAVDAAKCYKVQLHTDGKRVNNWLVFGCASEQARIALGMGGDAARVEKCVADQLRWFDPNGMYRDPNQPAVYDIVTRLQFMLALHYGYDGPSRAKLEGLLDRSAEPTLAMLSAAGEIPYGGRSNQFLHNHTFYAAVCEWYASRYHARGDAKKAARFRRAAREAVDALQKWLAVRPMRHVKNFYPRGSGERGSGMGCEGYAYFDKYMVTMGSWAMLGYLFADETIPAAAEPAGGSAPSSFVTTPDFHWVLLKAGDYSAQFDYNADTHYDCDGLGRLHRRGAPPAICMSTPCARKPRYSTELTNECSLAVVPSGFDTIIPAGNGSEGGYAWADWTVGDLSWKCRLSPEGLDMSLSGSGDVALKLPAFEFDGEWRTEISCDGKNLSVRYCGWVCTYTSDGEIVDRNTVCCNRNGRYHLFEARGTGKVRVKVAIRKEGSRE